MYTLQFNEILSIDLIGSVLSFLTLLMYFVRENREMLYILTSIYSVARCHAVMDNCI